MQGGGKTEPGTGPGEGAMMGCLRERQRLQAGSLASWDKAGRPLQETGDGGQGDLLRVLSPCGQGPFLA